MTHFTHFLPGGFDRQSHIQKSPDALTLDVTAHARVLPVGGVDGGWIPLMHFVRCDVCVLLHKRHADMNGKR